jgi:hypothetical protein
LTESAVLAALQQLQAQRLRETYRDFLIDPEYAQVAQFFFGEVYSGEDTSERDTAYAHFYRRIKRILGGEIGRCMGTIQDLQHLTQRLDRELAAELHRRSVSPETLDIPQYEKAYARTDHRELRKQQISLLADSLLLAYQIFHRVGIGTGLRALHQFQKMRGDTLVSGFLVRAYEAIHPLKQIQPLASAIDERETQRLHRIFQENGHP